MTGIYATIWAIAIIGGVWVYEMLKQIPPLGPYTRGWLTMITTIIMVGVMGYVV